MTIRGDYADLSAFDATLSDVARLLGREGSEGEHETFDVRRAMAVGVLADPGRAATLLAGDDDPGATPQRTRTFDLVAHLSEAHLLGIDPTLTDDRQRSWLTDIVARWAGRADSAVRVQPIRHCGGCADCDHDTRSEAVHPAHNDVDRYAPSAHDQAVVWARDPVCIFPWCHRRARRCDLDHRDPFDHDHPDQGGPTCPCNLAPLCRHHHRLETHAGWTYTTIEPGVHLWTDRYGQTFLRTRDGTTDLTDART